MIPIDGEELLHKISAYTLCTWNYKGQDPKTFRHYGPMAQDFHKAFGHDAYGTIGNDTLINQADYLGVSFAAIAALEKRTEKIARQQDEIVALQNENQKLRSMLEALNKSVADLNQKMQTVAMAPNEPTTSAGK
jgi:hypothetical protein